MARTLCFAVTTIVAFLLATPGHALHCNGTIIAIPAGDETLYIDDRSSAPGEINHWTYLESNDVEGLQSGDYDPCLDCGPFAFTDPCEHADPDTYII